MVDLIILLCCFVVIIYVWKFKRPKNFPPGPQPTPFIGNIINPPHGLLYLAVEEWSKKYGPIIGLSFFNQLSVQITGAENVLAALRKEEFQSRPDDFTTRDRSFGRLLGIFLSSGEQWASTRKFVVKQLAAFGKNEKENIMADEICQLMEKIKDGTTIQGTGIFGLSAVNVIWMIFANKRLDVNDEKSREFLNNLFTVFRQGNPTGSDFVNIVPILRYFDPKYKFALHVTEQIKDYIREAIQEHREVLDPNNPIDIVDNYLVEIERNKQIPNSYFTEEDLIMVGVDLFSAGSESTSNSIEFILLYMILYPEVQAKMQEELDNVLGKSRKPELEDKSKLHYTMAVLNEVERINMVTPTSVPHSCTKDTTFGGYFIPKGTRMNMNLWSLGHDPQYWKNPDEFNPERFLNADGKYTKSPICHTFGLGARTCVGEVMARNTIFLFTTTFFEKFSISLPPGEPKPSTLALPGFTTAPRPFKIAVKSR